MILKRFLLALCLFNSHSIGLAATDATDANDELYLRLESLQRQGNVVSPTLVKAIIEHKRRTGPNAVFQSSLLYLQHYYAYYVFLQFSYIYIQVNLLHRINHHFLASPTSPSFVN